MTDSELFDKVAGAGCFDWSDAVVSDEEAEMVKQGLLTWLEDMEVEPDVRVSPAGKPCTLWVQDCGEDSDVACSLSMGWTGSGDGLLCKVADADGSWLVVWYNERGAA